MKFLRALAPLCCALLLAATSAAPVDFTIAGIDEAPDLHGDPATSQLTIFAAGNQFFVMPALIAAFERGRPGVRSVFYETLPPGIEASQVRAGRLQVGNLVLSVRPDIVMAGRKGLTVLHDEGLASAPVAYVSNNLAIEVRAGNPKHVAGLSDLARSDLRVAMPNPKWEGVAAQISQALRKVGGASLEHQVMVTKVTAGTTTITAIHHRQTPRWVAAGTVDAGVVWASEARYARKIGLPIATVAIPAAQNVTGNYDVAAVVDAPHPAAAKAFAKFLTTPAAYAIYAQYGFGRPIVGGKTK